MRNEHQGITGARELTDMDVALINRIKAKGEDLQELVDLLRSTPGIDQRWVSKGATDLQVGLMSLTRAVAQPTTF